jgi:N-acetyl-anhydromuramyl-L-alanine amidase AmpD
MVFSRRTFFVLSGTVLASLATGNWYWRNRWNYIVIHHSAGNFGSIDFLQQVHRQRQAHDPIDAIPYHFVIGNGNGLGLGEIASDWRQHNHVWGSHVSANNWDRNWQGIGICLIGNFEQHPVPPAQYRALVELTEALMLRYAINVSNINGHGYISGESTLCPGRLFPMDKFLRDIA